MVLLRKVDIDGNYNKSNKSTCQFHVFPRFYGYLFGVFQLERFLSWIELSNDQHNKDVGNKQDGHYVQIVGVGTSLNQIKFGGVGNTVCFGFGQRIGHHFWANNKLADDVKYRT